MRILLALTLLLASAARAELPSSPGSPGRTTVPEKTASSPRAEGREDRPPILGVVVDGGFPDGLALSGVYRPWLPLRLDAGLTYNLIGFGLRAGATFVPFRFGVSPVLRGEYGHTFNGDATTIVERFTTLTPAEQTLLKSVSYDYASLQLGLEFGSPDRLVFFMRGGIAWFWTTVQNFEEAARLSNSSTTSAQDPKVRGTVPTASLGLLFYFW